MSNMPRTHAEHYDEFHAEDQRQADIKRLEKDIEYGELRLKRGEAYLRLESNSDWKEIIEEGYFKDLANGAIKSLGKGRDSNVPKEDWVEILASIGHLQTYLEGVVQFNAQAQSLLPQMKEELVSLKAQNATFQ